MATLATPASHAMPGHLVRRLHQAATQCFANRMRAAGLEVTPVQFAAMDALHARPRIDQATVAELIAYDRATIGGVLSRLRAKGWISRSVNTRDRRAREVELSPEGRRVYARLLPVVKAVQQDFLAALTPRERASFVKLTGKALVGRGFEPHPAGAIEKARSSLCERGL